jgi:branched-chain amino acid transport system permease protein
VSAYWPFIVIGIFTGSIYGLASMGVVLTYKTAGVFNFAYWQLHDSWHITAWLALPILLLVVAPIVGIVFEAVFRPIAGQSAEVQIVVSLALLAGLEALTPLLYGAQDRTLQQLFPISTFLLGGHLHVGWDQLGTLVVSLAMGAVLYVLLRRTRFGTATRAVADNRDLASIIGVNGDNVRRGAWIISSVFAALVGILLSPSQGLDVYVLTTVVIYAFAPAVFGRLVSLPLAYGGAIILGITQSVLSKYGSSGTIADLEAAIPYLALFVLLVVLSPKLKELGRAIQPTARRAALEDKPIAAPRRYLGLDMPIWSGIIGVGILLLLPLAIRGPRLSIVTAGAIYAIIALTLVVLTGWAGQISLAQFSFVGIGAFTAGHLAGSHGQNFVFATLVGMAIAVPLGLVVGLVSLRLSGLYLALSTMALALMMDDLVFNRPDVSGGLTGIVVPRPDVLGLSFASKDRLYELAVIVFALLAFGALALRRGPIGRRLHILRDSPVAASTLGVNLTVTKLVTFAFCGMVAALGGALYGALEQAITPTDFTFAFSLELLLLVVLGGRSVISGAVLAGTVYAVQLLPIPVDVSKYIPLTIALGVLALASQPEGTLALAFRETRRVLTVLRPRPRSSSSDIPTLALPTEGVPSGA